MVSSDSGMNLRPLLLLIGSLVLPLACGEPAGPDYATLVITTTSLPNAVPTVPYSETLVATGGISSYTWSITVGSLPTGLSLTTSTGIISGTPGEEGANTFTVQVASGDGQTDTQQLTIAVYTTLAMTTTWLSNAVLNVPYSDTLMATGGDSVYSWSVTVGSLPTGLSLNTSTGVISGTPSVVGSNTFTVQVASGDGQTDTQQKTITVATTPILQPNELCSDYPDSAIATFEDANLETAIRSALSVGVQEDLTCVLIVGLTDLDAESLEIGSLVGIQNLTSLTHVNFRSNSISDISALSGLTNLIDLDLRYNSISDISALSGLTSLTYLNLFANSITDIGPLSGLTSLWWLSLQANSISDISALGGLTSLTSLNLHGNSIHDINVLSGLTGLTGLHLASNSISDISALGGLTSLTDLRLWDNSISDISVLSGLTNLANLNLAHNSIADISALSGLTNLTSLWLFNNPNLTDIQALLDNTGLGAGDTVYIWSTNVSCTDVAALEAKEVTVLSDCP
jgi:Leucine-rich repeat (LRR) protein